MGLKFAQPIDGSAAYLEDEKGRRVYFPAPSEGSPSMSDVADGTPVEAVASTATLTYGASAVTAAKQVTFGGITYTFRAAVAADYDVKIEALVDDTATNLVNAINLNQAPGVGDNAASGKYMAPAANPFASAVLTAGSNLITLTALVKGVAGDVAFPTTDEAQITPSTFATESTGVDGRPGFKGNLLVDASNLYVCIADSTVASAGTWKKTALSAL
jgi:hypothetical protein